MFRVQRLLMTEYIDFNDFIMVESSFAQITGVGRGIRQVHIALSETNLIIAADKFHNEIPNAITNVYCCNIDPEVETLELLYIIPLKFLRLKLQNIGTRQILRVDVQNYKTWFFEHGLHIFRDLFWNEWQTAIANLQGKGLNSSICNDLLSSSQTDSSFDNIYQKIYQTRNNSTFLQSELNSKMNCFAFDKFLKQYVYVGNHQKKFPNLILRNTVNLYLETQSEIIGIQNHGRGMRTYFRNESRSVSADDIYSRCRYFY